MDCKSYHEAEDFGLVLETVRTIWLTTGRALKIKRDLQMIPAENKLLDLLSNNAVTFFIPPYQRNYEWTDEQCRVFYEDMLKTRDTNVAGKATEHFFGTITYFETEAVFGQPHKLVLIDGQQRITTTMLFLIALRNTLTDDSMKQFIDSHYLKNDNVSGDNSEYKIKLKQVESDWSAYKKLVLEEDCSDKDKMSAVYRNYVYFKDRIQSATDNGENIVSMIDKGLGKFSVITIELKPSTNAWENPQEIFESMNSIGKPLSLADLVRNYLMLGMNPEQQEDMYHKYWLRIEETLPGHVSDYIRDYMQYKMRVSYKKATEANYKELYSKFKDAFGRQNASDTLHDLADNAATYAYLMPNGQTNNTRLDEILGDIRYMHITTAFSFLLALLVEWKNGAFTDDDICELLGAFRIYSMRRRLLQIRTAENKVFPVLTNSIDELKKNTDKRTAMFTLLSNQESDLRLPNDIETSRCLETMNFYNFQYCKFYLACIEEYITKSRPDLLDTNLQIEHIMPQVLNDQWKNDLGPNYEDVHQEYVNNIGNLTLIRQNQELGQKAFSEKKTIYENNAGLQIAKTMITNVTSWDEQSIKNRTAWITNILLHHVLAIPDSMRKANNFSIKKTRGINFDNLGIIGRSISFRPDPAIKAIVVNDHEVEFEGKRWRLSPLTHELQKRRGNLNASGAYYGAWYWEFGGNRLSKLL